MKYKVTETILDYEGKPIKEGEKDLTWRQVIFTALNTFSKEDAHALTTEQKMKCYNLTNKVFASNDPDYTVDDVSFILERIRKSYAPLVCGRAEEFFNIS